MSTRSPQKVPPYPFKTNIFQQRYNRLSGAFLPGNSTLSRRIPAAQIKSYRASRLDRYLRTISATLNTMA